MSTVDACIPVEKAKFAHEAKTTRSIPKLDTLSFSGITGGRRIKLNLLYNDRGGRSLKTSAYI